MPVKVNTCLPEGVLLKAPVDTAAEAVLTPEALGFVAELTRRFRPQVQALLSRRRQLQAQYTAGHRLDFLPETAALRSEAWKAAPLPLDLLDRRVELTGPPVRKMVINALNSGANVYMADFEDACAPTWDNLVQGQVNLRDAVHGRLSVEDPNTGHVHRVGSQPATLMVRPRGWHLWESRMQVDEAPVPGALFDFGMYLFHNWAALRARDTGSYFYLPKLQGHLEARLWRDVFEQAQSILDIPEGIIRATVLIETLPAVFEMDEIIYALKNYITGLNCGRWDYIFSFIKTRQHDPEALLPNRSQVTMSQPCMRAYVQLLIRTCHRRGIHAMGGMAAYIPIKDNLQAHHTALGHVRADKLLEVQSGHDGTWVAHPGLVAVAREIFDIYMPQPNQISNLREDVHVCALDLLEVPQGTRTYEGLRSNIEIGLKYLTSWLGGQGCVPIHHLMEDMATAEISRAQIWQWLHHKAVLEDGTQLTPAWVCEMLRQEASSMQQHPHSAHAAALLERLSLSEKLEDFLTLAVDV